MKFFDAFSGIGGFRLGMERAGHTCVGGAEWDKYARGIYERRFGHSETHFGDIRAVDPARLPDFDCLVGGFPCFPAGTDVLTISGPKAIETILPGDVVYTHAGRYSHVIHSMVKPYGGDLVKISLTMGVPSITSTPEHPFYVTKRNAKNTRRGGKSVRLVTWSDPEWTPAEDIVPGDSFAMFPINTESVIPSFSFTKAINQTSTRTETIDMSSPALWYLAGKYVADGWRLTGKRVRGGRTAANYRIVIACDAKDNAEVTRVVNAASTISGTTVCKEGPVKKVHISHQGLWMVLEAFGQYAHGKRIPEYVQRLPHHLAAEFLRGYVDGDGSSYNDDRGVSITTVSKELVLGLQRLIMKVHGVVPSISLCRVPKTKVICGRTVNQRDFYQVRFLKDRKREVNSFVRNGYAYIRIVGREVVGANGDVPVYNLEVSGDNSYCTGPVAVHNCQAFSIAGRRGGFSDTRGTLFFEVARIAQAKRPRILFLENVRGLLSHGKGWTFWTILKTLDDLGYDASWAVCNSADLGVPQNRERVFIVGHLRGGSRREVFPLRESYPWDQQPHGEAEGKGQQLPDQGGEVAGTIRPGARTAQCGTLISCLDANYYKGGGRTLVELTDGAADAQRVYDPDGVAKTLKSTSGGQGSATGLYLIRKNMKGKGHREDEEKFLMCGNESPTIMTKTDYNPRVVYKSGYGDEAEFKEGDTVPPLKASDCKFGDSSPMIIQRNQRNEYVTKDEAGAVQTTMHGNAVSRLLTPDARIRRLTPRECERLQGFPDDWTTEGVVGGKIVKISDTQRYKVLGNAVTVNVIYEIARELA